MVFQQAVLLRRSAAANIAMRCTSPAFAARRPKSRMRSARGRRSARDRGSLRARAVGRRAAAARLARAWALRPEVMFLDEPRRASIPRRRARSEDIVRDIHARGTTIVMSTHNLAQAKRLATDVVFLSEAGRWSTRPRHVSSFAAHVEAAAFLEGERL
jgi:tungstate transport system ATP-binding protein